MQYVVPLAVVAGDDALASFAPDFNEANSPNAILWPHLRARCLVSVERKSGWFHDLCFPGYLWADTEGKWFVPGLTYHGGMGSYDIRLNPLVAAFEELQQQESASGRWGIGGTRLPFGDERICPAECILSPLIAWLRSILGLISAPEVNNGESSGAECGEGAVLA